MINSQVKLQTESNTYLGFMAGINSKQNAIFSMNPMILWTGCTMNKLLALIARAKLILIAEEMRQNLKR